MTAQSSFSTIGDCMYVCTMHNTEPLDMGTAKKTPSFLSVMAQTYIHVHIVEVVNSRSLSSGH